VASFRDRARAEAYKKELVEKGYPYPRILKTEIPDRGIWHRVRIGRCESKADAERIAKEIQKLERLEPQVILEEN
jgi:cell division septation protein DedD